MSFVFAPVLTNRINAKTLLAEVEALTGFGGRGEKRWGEERSRHELGALSDEVEQRWGSRQ